MQHKETFGHYIRRLREEKRLPIRKIAAYLDIDPSTLSKIERGERSANRAMIEKLSEILGGNNEQLLVAFLSDKIMYELLNETCSEKVLQVAEKKIKYEKQKRSKQGNLDL